MTGLLRDIRRQVGVAAEKNLSAGLAKARFRDSNDALRKLCVNVDGQVQIKNDPPLIVPGEELLAAWGQDVDAWYGQIQAIIASYRQGLQSDRRHLFDQFAFVQLGFKMVGVGSVGTRAYILLMDGANAADPLVLQAKEAQRSVLANYVGGRGAAGQPGRTGGARPTADPDDQRHLPWLATGRRHRRAGSRLLHPPTAGRQGLRRGGGTGPGRHELLRPAVRPDPGPGPRPFRGSRRDRRLPGRLRRLRRRGRRLRHGVRGAERTPTMRPCARP